MAVNHLIPAKEHIKSSACPRAVVMLGIHGRRFIKAYAVQPLGRSPPCLCLANQRHAETLSRFDRNYRA